MKIVGINASRSKSGGAHAHLLGILRDGADPRAHGIEKIHVWSYTKMLDMLPNTSWIIKHNPPELEKSLLHQIWWEYRQLHLEAKKAGCDVLLNTDAGCVGDFHPCVVMSRDMLSFEPPEMRRYGFSLGRLRLIILKYIQARSMKRADQVVFLTQYAADTIQKSIGRLPQVSIIPHGVSDAFRLETSCGQWNPQIRCVYISNTMPYKHHWHVITAVDLLRKQNINATLLLAGGGWGPSYRRMNETADKVDPQGLFIERRGFIKHDKVPEILLNTDIFIFASSCENMPNTLLEAMASGLPIACSDRGPMPEILKDGGVYFDPEDPTSLCAALKQLIENPDLRMAMATKAKRYAAEYSWLRCSQMTWACLVQTCEKAALLL